MANNQRKVGIKILPAALMSVKKMKNPGNYTGAQNRPVY